MERQPVLTEQRVNESVVFLKDEQQVSRKAADLVSRVCQSHLVRVNKILPMTISIEGEVQLVTQEIILQGDFVSLVKCLSSIHQELTPIKIGSLKFEKVETTNKTQALVLNLFLQSVITKQ